MRILLSNDDGILAPGLGAIREELLKLGEVDVVAPETGQSATAHGITMPGPVAARKLHVQDDFQGWAVEGRPADCVKLGIQELLTERPDLVVSGINDGANISINILYSGTVAAAAEGALLGYPAVAVSLKQGSDRDFHKAARIALPIIRQLLDHGLEPGELVNINIPDLSQGAPKGVRVVPMASQIMEDVFMRFTAPDGRDYYWLTAETFAPARGTGQTDLDAVEQGYVAITPLQLDLTQFEQLDKLKRHEWRLE